MYLMVQHIGAPGADLRRVGARACTCFANNKNASTGAAGATNTAKRSAAFGSGWSVQSTRWKLRMPRRTNCERRPCG